MSTSARGWLELESDPGLFTLLVEDFGVKGVQVEEIYDLSSPVEGPVYGFIFLFKWIEERRSRRKMQPLDEAFVEDEDIINNIFFAQQVIPNSCATLALLSVLMNCADKIHLGETLSALKKFSEGFSPENKGYAIGNFPALAMAHNSHVRPEPRIIPEKQRTVSTGRAMEAFHFVSYMPINGRLFELDGLKPYPIDHGPWGEHEDWTKKFQRVISERLGLATGGEAFHDIRYNLMAVVADRRPAYEYKLNTLKTNRQIILDALQKMVNMTQAQTHGTQPATKLPSPIKSMATPSSTQGPQDYSGLPPDRAEPSVTMKAAEKLSSPKAVPETDKLDTLASVSTLISSSDHRISLPANPSNSPRSKAFQEIVHSSPIEARAVSGGGTASSGRTRSPIQTAPSGSPKKSPSHAGSPISPVKSGNLASDGKSPTLPPHQERHASESPSNRASPRSTSPRVSSPRSSSPRAASPRGAGHAHSSPIPGTINSSPPGGLGAVQQSYPQAFAPKDLLTLLRNVETEIQKCEQALKEEREKRLKYYIDHCRRVHNYDQFICTFLTMLAEQGLLAPLVEEHTSVKRCVVQRRVVPKAKQNGKRPAKKRRTR